MSIDRQGVQVYVLLMPHDEPTRTAWRRPEVLLLVMAGAMALSFSVWSALLNNFAIERAAFDGADMGLLQSIREVPGFLAFTFVFLLLFLREQRLAILFLGVLGIGVAVTGAFPTLVGLVFTTTVMSVGFHYFETAHQSLTLQWIDKDRAAHVLGRIVAARAVASLIAFGFVWLAFERLGLDFAWVYAIGGGVTVAVVLFAWGAFPTFPAHVEQRRSLVLRRRYWLYYALTFLSGARRQIFIVFAGFLLVEKFGYSVAQISLLLLVNHALSVPLAPRIGKLIGKWGERRALTFEYVGLIGVFAGYAFVQNATVAAGLYIVDHAFFALAIAIKTYFQKIADPADIAPTAGVAFTINHIAAVVIPVAFGIVWLTSPATVFLAGAAMAAASLICARLVPPAPEPGHEVVHLRTPAPQPAE